MELLAAIHDVPAEEVIVLPNSSNVIMAAERAAELSDKLVARRADALAAGGADGGRGARPEPRAEENGVAMHEAIVELSIGSVAPAARDDVHGRFTAGDAVGFVDDAIIAWGEPEATLGAVIRSPGARRRDRHLHLAARARRCRRSASRRSRPTASSSRCATAGQPAYWWLLAAE